METIGKRIKALRKAQGIPMRELAQAVGVTTSAISELEQDRSKSTTVLHRIASHLGVSTEWLDTGTGPKYRVQEAPAGYQGPARPMFQIMADSVKVLREYLEIRDEPASWLADPALLQLAYQVVEEHGRSVEPEDMLELTKRLASLRRS